jgi:predicted RNA binding protein YcfA (HicA-like mRNA interferase family)
MELPYASWCQAHANLAPQQFLSEFYRDNQPTTKNLANLANCIFSNMPKNETFLEIQDIIWGRLEGLDLKTWGNLKLTEQISYKAYQERKVESDEQFQKSIAQAHKTQVIENIMLDAEAHKDVAPIDPKILWKKYFPTQTLEEVCQMILGEIPLDRIAIDDIILILINSLILKMPQDNLDVYEFAVKLITGTQISFQQVCINQSGRTDDPSTFMEAGRKLVVEFSLRLKTSSSDIEFKGTQDRVKKLQAALYGLCSIMNEAFSNVYHARQLSKPISNLLSEETLKKTPCFSPTFNRLCLQITFKSLAYFKKFYGNGVIKNTFEAFEKDLASIDRAISNIDPKQHLPSLLLKLHNQKISSCRKFLTKMESIFNGDGCNQIKNWLFIQSPSHDLTSIIPLLFMPLLYLEKNFKNGLTHLIKFEKERSLQLLPDGEKLVANLTVLYENRMNISSYLDILRINTQTIQDHESLLIEKTGRSYHETLTEFAINSSRMELNKLITLLKPMHDIDNVHSGDILGAINHLKTALPDYLEALIRNSIGDADEVLECLEKVSVWEKECDLFDENSDTIILLRDNITITNLKTRVFLEAVAWLRVYFDKQHPVWNEELIKAPAAPVKKKKKPQKGKKKPLSKTKKKPEPKVDIEPVASVPLQETPPPVVIPVVPSEKSSKPTDNELWKAEVARIRSMRETARRLRRIEEARIKNEPIDQADIESVEKVLQGSLRRRSPKEIAYLAGEKVKIILKELKKDGWIEDHVTGDHHIFKHPSLRGHLSIPYTSKSDVIDRGTFQSIAKTAGWAD